MCSIATAYIRLGNDSTSGPALQAALDAGHAHVSLLHDSTLFAREHALHTSKLLRLISGSSSHLGSEKGNHRARRHTSGGAMDSNGGIVVEDQGVLIEQALGSVRTHSNHMRRCLENPSKLLDAVKAASSLCSELRISTLTPKAYYELYMAVFDALKHLSVAIRDEHPTHHLADLYELVQYAGNIVPRLYLMITVGTVYMGVEDAPVKEIMKDMQEMLRGIQNPLRGMFARYYLLGEARDNLPTGSGDGPEGNLSDSISFILTNFVEMNKLWVRLQHQGHSREREQRTRERQELQLLVGSNLVRLSQLVDLDAYKTVILHPLLEQVVMCRDVLAQEYLLEVITQVFPDEFHLNTLDQLLQAIARLNPHVNIKGIVIGLMNRLSAYAEREAEELSPEDKQKSEEVATAALLEKLRISKEKPAGADETEREGEESNGTHADAVDGQQTKAEDSSATAESDQSAPKRNRGIPEDVRLYEVFYGQVTHLVQAQRLPIQDTVALLVSLANLALKIYPERLDYMDQILAFANEKVAQFTNSADLHSPQTQSSILSLLLAPIATYHSLFTALALPNFAPLLHAQIYPTRRAVATEVTKNLLSNSTLIRSPEQLDSVLEILRVLIREGMQQSGGYPAVANQRRNVETDETIEEQTQLARILHLVKGNDNDTQFKLLQRAYNAFKEGTERIKYTTSAFLTLALKLARSYKQREHLEDNWSSQSSTLYKFMHTLISALYTRVTGTADLCLRLFINCGSVADQCGFEEVAYEFFAQAFTIYEESISDSRAQFQSVCIIAGALHQVRNFGKENYDTLITKCTLHGSKLLKKPDQCRAVYLCSHLWWPTPIRSRGEDEDSDLYRDGKRVLECLQRALRVADACMDSAVSVELFVEVLNRYVYYFDQQNDQVTVKYINGLIELIHSNVHSNEENTALETPKRHFQRTLDVIAAREYEDVITSPP